jgi:hypothetical protein
MKIFFHWLIIVALMPLSLLAQDAQFVPYRGGQADGHHIAGLSGFTQGTITMFGPFAGGVANGYAADSIINFNPRGTALLFAPFAGSSGDGFAADSLMAFNPRAYISSFTPFAGGLGDGYAEDSLIVFNPRGYITMYGPFAGGVADGYFEGVICNYPKIEGDTTLILKCSNDVVNLNELVQNYNFAGRWNTANPATAGPGNYELRINNSGKCLDTAYVTVALDVITWNGNSSNDWHTVSNWTPAKIPGALSHVIVPGGRPNPCIIQTADAEAASVQTRTGATVSTANGRKLNINGTCVSLPN